MPRIAEIEFTPNPNARKFILRDPLTYGVTRSYENAEQAMGDALAEALFAIPHVTNVFYVDHWLTVTQDGKAHWPDLLRQLAVPIRDAPSAQERSAELINESAGQVDGAPRLQREMTEEERDKLAVIREMLDEQVRPYLQGDGGDLHVIDLEGNLLKVHYQGACGSCPSSISGTLAGIESMVRRIDPELEVIAV
ncbi:MAG TPA: NifU family protein [Burkholderiales bacterium]|nr:NifU family protein [Burkholderiales bacterium]